MSNKDLTFSEHAELWYTEQGNIVPEKGTKEWDDMYEKWHEFAFADFADDIST